MGCLQPLVNHHLRPLHRLYRLQRLHPPLLDQRPSRRPDHRQSGLVAPLLHGRRHHLPRRHPGRPIRLHPRPARSHAAHDSVHVLLGQQHQHHHGDITAPARCLLPLCGLQPHRRLRTDLPGEKRRLCLGRHLSLTTTIGGLVSPLVAGVLTSGALRQPFKSSGSPPSSAPSLPSSSPSRRLGKICTANKATDCPLKLNSNFRGYFYGKIRF